ncbi:MAG: histidine phosphatase family protein [Pseudomonadota bacterium]
MGRQPEHGIVYLLRHGAIESSAGGRRYIGQTDLPLCDIGVGQARTWVDFFAAADLAAITSSDLARCMDTARIIAAACSLPVRAMPAFREIDLGRWDGLSFDDVKTRYPEAFQQRGENIADYRPPGGESFRDLQSRAWPAFEALSLQTHVKNLIVTHAGVIRVLLCRILGMSLSDLFEIELDYGTLTTIEISPDGCRVLAVNQHYGPQHPDFRL